MSEEAGLAIIIIAFLVTVIIDVLKYAEQREDNLQSREGGM